MADVTQILSAVAAGDPQAAADLLPLVYDELRKLADARMAAETPGQTLQPTALVHEAYLRLVARPGTEDVTNWECRGHFFAAAAEAMRRILVDNARRKQAVKYGGDRCRVDLNAIIDPALEESSGDDLLALDDALRQLEVKDQRKAELVKLRFFAGFSTQQAAVALGVSTSTAEKDWAYARSWLRVTIDRASSDQS